jgi:hypothetical protein
MLAHRFRDIGLDPQPTFEQRRIGDARLAKAGQGADFGTLPFSGPPSQDRRKAGEPRRRAAVRAPSTCQVGLAGCRQWQGALGIYDQPMLQISAQTRNVWVLEALCSAAVR